MLDNLKENAARLLEDGARWLDRWEIAIVLAVAIIVLVLWLVS